MEYAFIWLILAGICIIGEIFTAGFLLFCPGIAAFCAFICSWIGLNTTIQCIVFALVTAILVIFVRPIITKVFKVDSVKTNVASIVGKNGLVTKSISPSSNGQVKVDGEVWTAVSSQSIDKGESITVLKVDGVKLDVKKVN